MIKSRLFQRFIPAYLFSQTQFSAIFQADQPIIRVKSFSQINFADFNTSVQEAPQY